MSRKGREAGKICGMLWFHPIETTFGRIWALSEVVNHQHYGLKVENRITKDGVCNMVLGQYKDNPRKADLGGGDTVSSSSAPPPLISWSGRGRYVQIIIATAVTSEPLNGKFSEPRSGRFGCGSKMDRLKWPDTTLSKNISVKYKLQLFLSVHVAKVPWPTTLSVPHYPSIDFPLIKYSIHTQNAKNAQMTPLGL
ncbi:hypothetical protein EVAR_49774_1 [Eumeta japonica]|uniref:Uncharacterized protein n=1 Tax=Eumeta variegata TaxID=151549 RepID=A0A4C1Y574_EUMVA|nr:hypothetical protein EVAR_49774_1 [Eumeta japonica]